MTGGPEERYEMLGIGESLPRIYQYPIACTELSIIIRGAYSKLPKTLQSLIFQHTLTAFRFLPLMQTQKAVSAANLLIQSAEAVLPKQKKVLAVTEFRHAKIAHKRHSKDREEGSTQLPQDVLVHIFSYLDLRSLLSAASVCCGLQRCRMFENDEHMGVGEEVDTGTGLDWRDTFIKTYKGNSLKKLTSYRGYCGHCNAVVWLNKMKCSNQHFKLNSKNQQIKPISTDQIVEYILNGTLSTLSSSESDSDSDGESISKLWAFPRHLSGCQK